MMNYMSPTYNNDMFKSLSLLQSDLKEGNIDRKQFNFLLGLVLKKQVNDFARFKVSEFTDDGKLRKSMTFISYVHNRQANHA